MTRTTVSRIALTIAIGALALSTGCRGRIVVQDARVVARYQRNLTRIAARDTGCSEAQLTTQQIASQPAVVTVMGCTAPAEYWLRCGRRRCSWERVATLNEVAAPLLACGPQGIMQQPSPAPNLRYATGCGQTAPFTMICNGAACGWAPSGPPQPAAGAAGPVVAGSSGPPSGAVVARVQGQIQAPDAALQTQIQQQREAILSCIDAPPLTLRLRWTSDGQVIVQMPQELVGSAAEGCIQAVLGGLRVAAQAAGEIVVPVQ